MRPLLISIALLSAVPARAEAPFVPPPPEQVPGYSAKLLPCKISDEDGPTEVTCDGDIFDGKTLRELAIMRNLIYSRYGWDGYRKPWLREYFHKQPWFKANPRFSYKLLSAADRKNVHFIGTFEHSFKEPELRRRQSDIYARHGRIWNDKPEWRLKNGKVVHACDKPKGAVDDDESKGWEDDRGNITSWDCFYEAQAKAPQKSRAIDFAYAPTPRYTDDLLSQDERIELGLLSRALGTFAGDDLARGKTESSLESVLKVAELRQLSLRDLRLLRNTIYAKRGRPFKSKILRDHFGRLSWYKVNADYTDKLLSDNDRRNIALIKSVENEFGGPLKDEDWLIEPAVDMA